ncbi:MAG: O-antigen translocase [Bacteroidetes bacterium]|nr:O-antigen translocase [Bacteroidota bacterium]
MKLPKFIGENLLLKMTSLNAVVVGVRLIISLFIQRLLAELVGEAGIAKIGQLRNVMAMLMSVSTLGVFNGIVKYVSEFREDKKELQKLFSTTFVFVLFGTFLAAVLLFFGASLFSNWIFGNNNFVFLFKILSVVVPCISVHRVFNGVVNGLSAYKKFVKIELFGYLLASSLLVYCLYNYDLNGVLIAIAVTPVIQLGILVYIFGSVLKEYLHFKEISFKIPYAKQLLAFTLMSIVSTILLNYIEIDIRNMIKNKITENDSGYWTAMTNISKNYMVFSGSLFTLYVIPRFSNITSGKIFKKEVFHIYKTLLPIFGLGMIVIYIFRDYVIDLVYPNFLGMEPLFKWQLLGDFVRLGSLVIAHQFLAKKMVRSFIFTEFLSIALFYVLSKYFIVDYGAEGVVMAHFIRYIIYFIVVLFLLWRYFKKQKISIGN